MSTWAARNQTTSRISLSGAPDCLQAEYSFYCGMGPARAPIVPLPRVTGLQLAGGGQAARLELTGEDFAPGLQVWFGEVEADTVFRSAESIYCLVPDIQQFCSGPAWTAQPGPTQVTIQPNITWDMGWTLNSAVHFNPTGVVFHLSSQCHFCP